MNTKTKLLLTLPITILIGINETNAATTADTQFTGAVGNVCSVTAPVSGTLVPNGWTQMTTEGSGGARGHITVACNSNGTVSLSAISVVSGASTTNWSITMYDGATSVASRDQSATVNLVNYNFGDADKTFDLKAVINAAFTVGTHTYKTTITVTAL